MKILLPIIEDLSQMITMVGFPIVVSVALWLDRKETMKIIKENTKVTKELKNYIMTRL